MIEKYDFNENIKRISILGGSGTGKSTLANILSKRLSIPAIHLDSIQFKPNWVEVDKVTRDKKILECAERETWIIDGNYTATLKERVAKADLIIWLDYSTSAQVKGILKRRFENINKERKEIPGCKEKLELEFLKYVITYNKKKRPIISEMLKEYENKKVITFKNQRILNKWLKKL